MAEDSGKELKAPPDQTYDRRGFRSAPKIDIRDKIFPAKKRMPEKPLEFDNRKALEKFHREEEERAETERALTRKELEKAGKKTDKKP